MIDEEKYWKSMVGTDWNQLYAPFNADASIKVSRTARGKASPEWHLSMLSRMKHMDEARATPLRDRLKALDMAIRRNSPYFIDVESKHWAETEADRMDYDEARACEEYADKAPPGWRFR